jgi:hypothetical protein
MAPAFSSAREAGLFGLLVLVVLALPLLIPKSALPPREQIYAALPWEVGPFPYIHQQIFEEKSDVDIAIMGSSRTWASLATPYLQEKLSEKLGRKAVVVSVCWPWAGFDALYMMSRDLMQQRKVHMLIFSDETSLMGSLDAPHEQAWRWLRYSEETEEMSGLSWQSRLAYYYGTVLGMPRTLMTMLRPNLPPVLTPEKFKTLDEVHHWIMPPDRLGALSVKETFPDRTDDFAPYTPDWSASPSEVVTYSSETASDFKFGQGPTDSLQIYYAQKLAAMAKAHDTQLVCLNVPSFTGRRLPELKEPYFWPDTLHAPVTMLGIPSSELFSGLTDQDITKLFWDNVHFNLNGQEYFTRIVAPKLFDLYAEPQNH